MSSLISNLGFVEMLIVIYDRVDNNFTLALVWRKYAAGFH